MNFRTIFQIILILLSLNNAFGIEKSNIVKTEIKKVTVFDSGALIEREGFFTVKAGVSTVEFKGIPDIINNKTVVISTNNNVKILDFNFYKEETNSQIEKSNLYGENITVLEKQIRLLQNKDKNRKEKMSFYKGLKNSLNSVVKRNYFVAIDKELYKIENFLFSNENKENKNFYLYTDSISLLEKEIESLKEKSKKLKYIPKQIISVNLKSKQNIQTKFSVRYFVKNAGWYPFYNVDIFPNKNKAKLNFLSTVYQETGEDWDNVKLTISTENPIKLDKIPNLKPIILTKYNNSNILGSGIYKPNLKHNLKKPSEKEFFIREFETKNIIKKFVLKNNHTLKSNGRDLKLKLETKYLRSKYKDIIYLNKGSEIKHNVIVYNNSPRTYESGNINLFLESEFKGKRHLSKMTPDDSVVFHLGSDKNVSIFKKNISSKVKEATIFNSIETKKQRFEFIIKNNGKFVRTLTLIDFISVARSTDVKVKILTPKWKHNNTNGKIECSITISPNEKIVLPMEFEISYPEGEFY